MSPADLAKKLTKARELMALGQFPQAIALYAMLVGKFPNGHGEYGSAVAESGDFELANRLWEKFRALAKGNGKALGWLAWECSKVGMHAKAQELWTEAAITDPCDFEVQIRLARVLIRNSGVEATRAVVNRCVELNPQSEEARYMSLHLDRRENKPDVEGRLREMLAANLQMPQLRYSCYADLAHILDRAERFDEAIAILEDGKKFVRENLNLNDARKPLFQGFDEEMRQAQTLPKNILEIWGRAFPPPERNVMPPIAMLTGSARSGTTLLERVLDAHPAVAAFDETLAFNKLQPRIDIKAAHVPAQRLNVTRELYMKNVATILGTPVAGMTLLDKNPSRTNWLPWFLRLFPELRVVVALRDPRDIMVSLYFQDHPYTNYRTFEEHAQQYASIMDAWLIVREWEGLDWMETRYEDTVADVEKEGSRVTKFLGLEWNDKQGRFFEHNREKPVLSNNAPEVAKPVYKRAVGRWRVYEKQLAPVLPILEPYCRKFGYE